MTAVALERATGPGRPADSARIELRGVWKWFSKPSGEPYPALGGIDRG